MPTFLVIPCGGAKGESPAAARDLYTGQMFRHALRAAEFEAADCGGTVLVLSALYGLIPLDAEIAPYDVRMGDAGSVSPVFVAAQAAALGIEWRADVFAFLPRAYFAVLDAALRALDVYAADVYEAAPGIGYQRGACSAVLAR